MANERTALITGATGGIGEELCVKFANRGYRLVITARKVEQLEALAQRLRSVHGVEVVALPADLREEDAPQQIFDAVIQQELSIDVLVNNAGFGLGGSFVQNWPDLQMAMIQVNIAAMTRLCRLFLPHMAARGRGKVLNVASTGAFVAGPMNSVYCASKAYVLSLSEALAEEMEMSGVTVTALCPGATHTGFAGRAGMENTRLFRFGVMMAREVAEAGFEAMNRGKRVEIVGIVNKVMMQALRFVPRVVGVKVSKAIQRPLGW